MDIFRRFFSRATNLKTSQELLPSQQFPKNPIALRPSYVFAVRAMPPILNKTHLRASDRFVRSLHLSRLGSRIASPVHKCHRHFQLAQPPVITRHGNSAVPPSSIAPRHDPPPATLVPFHLPLPDG